MLKFFKGKPKHHLIPSDTRIYAIGDIHGHIEPLIKLHGQILEHDKAKDVAARKAIIYLGDYIDRGTASREVIDYLISKPLPGFEYIFLKGNHEQALIDFIEGPARSTAWLAWGGDATLLSYDATMPSDAFTQEELGKLAIELVQKIPESHKKFFNGLKLYHMEGDYMFVHAGLRPEIALDEQIPEDMLMIRDDFIKSRKAFPKKIVFGHTIFSEPLLENYKIGIDTGSYATGRLTAVVLEGDKAEFISTS